MKYLCRLSLYTSISKGARKWGTSTVMTWNEPNKLDCEQFYSAVLQPAVLSWHFRFKFPTPARQGSNSPPFQERTTVKCPWVARGMLKLSNWSSHNNDNNRAPFCFKAIQGLMNHEKPQIESLIRSRLYFCETHLPQVLSLKETWLDSSISDSEIFSFTATHLYGVKWNPQ